MTSLICGPRGHVFSTHDTINYQEDHVLNLQPLSITADGKDSQGNFCYKVLFEREDSKVEFVFRLDYASDGLSVLMGDPEFNRLVLYDPAATQLRKAICSFHEAREFQYEATSTAED
jgi:hypothetical protein